MAPKGSGYTVLERDDDGGGGAGGNDTLLYDDSAPGLVAGWSPARHIEEVQTEELREHTAEQRAGPVDSALMRWLDEYMAAGFSRRLELDDEMGLSGRDSGPALFLQFDAAWAKQQADGRAPSVLRSFWSVLGRQWTFAVAFNWLSIGLQLSGPMLIRQLVLFVEASQGKAPPPLSEGLQISGAIFLLQSLDALVKAHSMYAAKLTGLRIRNLMVHITYMHSLSLADHALQQQGTGKLINTIAADSQRYLTMMPTFINITNAPVMLVGASGIIYSIIGWPVFVALFILFLYSPIGKAVAKSQKRVQADKMAMGDQRLRLLTEIIRGIKVCKLMAWEEAMLSAVNERRSAEASLLQRFQRIQALSVAINMCWPIFALVAMLFLYAWSFNEPPSMADLFAVLALFKLIQSPFRAFSEGLASAAQASVSINRLHDILTAARVSDSAQYRQMSRCEEGEEGGGGGEVQIRCRGDFAWSPDGATVLRGIDLRVRSGELVVVAGTVGSGKSSLCACILGELHPMEAASAAVKPQMATAGKVAYVAQQPFILNASVKQNILFGAGRPYSAVAYQRAVDCAALRHDLDLLPDRDDTEIGSKGVNLSGGQKHRISLARALYSTAEIFVLDDPLAAVDAHVGNHIWEQAITGCLADKCVVLVTNQLQHLSAETVSEVLIMGSGGVIAERGQYDELAAREHGAFAELLLSNGGGTPRAGGDDDDTEAEAEPEAAAEPVSLAKEASIISGNAKKKPPTQLVQAEKRHQGGVPIDRYMGYYRVMNSPCFTATMLTMFPASELLGIVQDWWLAQWSTQALGANASDSLYLSIFGALAVFSSVMILVRSLMYAKFAVHAATSLHEAALGRILFVPLLFFERNPMGRILNRFSQDQDDCDSRLPMANSQFLLTGTRVVTVMMLTCAPNPVFIVALIPLIAIFFKAREYFRRSARETQRLVAVTASPVFASLEETLDGLLTIRAYRAQGEVVDNFSAKIKLNSSFCWIKTSLDQWLLIRLCFLGTVVVSGAALAITLARNFVNPTLVGLALSYSMVLIWDLRFFVRSMTDVEARLNAVDRLQEYAELPPELARSTDEDVRLAKDWPSGGAITISNLRMQYRPGEPLIG